MDVYGISTKKNPGIQLKSSSDIPTKDLIDFCWPPKSNSQITFPEKNGSIGNRIAMIPLISVYVYVFLYLYIYIYWSTVFVWCGVCQMRTSLNSWIPMYWGISAKSAAAFEVPDVLNLIGNWTRRIWRCKTIKTNTMRWYIYRYTHKYKYIYICIYIHVYVYV